VSSDKMKQQKGRKEKEKMLISFQKRQASHCIERQQYSAHANHPPIIADTEPRIVHHPTERFRKIFSRPDWLGSHPQNPSGHNPTKDNRERYNP
jgi:hypothetical protein